MQDKPLTGSVQRPADVSDKDQRLGGDGFCSPNFDREGGGGIVTRACVSNPVNEPVMSYFMPEAAGERGEGGNIHSGTAFRRSIRNSDM